MKYTESVYDRNIIICDLDGTIANVQHRLHYIKNPDGTMKPYAERDWDSFHAACVDDEPYKDVMEILHNLYDAGRREGIQAGVCGGGSEREIYFFSGRNESVRNETIAWLYRHFLSHSMCHAVEITREEAEMWEGRNVSYSLRKERGGEILRSDEGGDDEGKYFFLEPNLFMRSEGDRRPDTTVKYEMMYDMKLMPDDVLCILDDRQSVVDMWRENGFRVMQVDAWKEEERWQDKLRVQITETSEKHDLSGWTPSRQYVLYMAYRKATEVDNFFGTFEEFIASHPPYLSVPEYDLGDVNAATDVCVACGEVAPQGRDYCERYPNCFVTKEEEEK